MGVIVQEAFYIPDNIALGLAKGIYKRFGGVVRWAVGSQKGQIVTHLKPIKPTGAEQSLAKAIAQFASKHKTGLIISGIIVVGVATVGGVIYAFHRKKRKAFQTAFSNYLDAIKNQNMSLSIIEHLEESLDGIGYVNLSAEEFSFLIMYLKDYTLSIAENNGKQICNIQPSGNPIIDLNAYLQVQKKLFAA